MKIFDISKTISSDLQVWKGHPAIEIKKMSRISEGGRNNLSYLGMTVHTGTHVDSPYHFLDNGETVENLSLEDLIGPAVVVDLPPGTELIDVELLKKCSFLKGARRVLFKTDRSVLPAGEGSEKRFPTTALSVAAAAYLADCGIALLGIDSLSVGTATDNIKTHQTLLKAGVILLEGIDLQGVPQGEYDLYCLPLKIAGLDGAPARAVLIRQ